MYDSALNNMLIANQWHDSIWNKELINTTKAYEEKIAFQKQESELELKEMEIEQQKAVLKAHKYGITSLIVALLTTFLIALMVYVYLTKVRKLNLHLTKVIHTKNRIMSVIAHDIRSPLGGINSLSTLLLNRDLEEDERHNFSSQIFKSSLSVLNLMNNLLEWYNTQEKKVKLALGHVAVNKVVSDNIDLLQSMASEKKIEFDCEINNDVILWGDERSVGTVVRNILSNAIKFSPEKSIVKIWAETNEQSVLIHIKDNGKGMEQSHIDKLFSDIIDESKIGSQKHNGFGLGLMLCYELVKLNNGHIHVSSELNNGACFSIELPSLKS